MLQVYKTNHDSKKLDLLDHIEPDSWIDLITPSDEEIAQVVEATGVDADLLKKMRDDDELPRVEISGSARLVVIDVPATNDDADYITYPVGTVITDNNYFITVSPRKTNILQSFRKNLVNDFRTAKKTRFLIQIVNAAAAEYLDRQENIASANEVRHE